MNSIVKALVGGLVVGALACSSSSDGTSSSSAGSVTFSCSTPDEGCTTTSNIPSYEAAQFAATCTNTGGKEVSSCSGDFIGCCSGNEPGGTHQVACFDPGNDTAEGDCKSGGGTWTSGPP